MQLSLLVGNLLVYTSLRIPMTSLSFDLFFPQLQFSLRLLSFHLPFSILPYTMHSAIRMDKTTIQDISQKARGEFFAES